MSVSSKICIQSYLIFALLAAAGGELFSSSSDSGINGFLLDEHGPTNGKRANNCLLKLGWLLASSFEKKKTKALTYPQRDELPNSSCFIEKRLQDGALVFNSGFYAGVIVFYVEQSLV